MEFATEDEAIEFLKATYCTDAPLAFSYLDGPPVEAKVIDRINRRMFEGQVSGSVSNAADAVTLKRQLIMAEMRKSLSTREVPSDRADPPGDL